MFWGLFPHWAKDKSYGYKTINARAETVATLATYKEPFRHKRCIVPATGFYEPDKINFAKPPFPWHYFQVKDQKVFMHESDGLTRPEPDEDAGSAGS